MDEAGRGAWAGPLVVAAIILPPDWLGREYADSKLLTPRARERLAAAAKAEAVAWSVSVSAAVEVDATGVLVTTLAAAVRALAVLDPPPDGIITDYLRLKTSLPLLCPPRADSTSFTVAAASLIAKTTRDALMCALDVELPGYGFARHKGYGVPQHAVALAGLGVSVEHRRSFQPIKVLLGPQQTAPAAEPTDLKAAPAGLARVAPSRRR